MGGKVMPQGNEIPDDSADKACKNDLQESRINRFDELNESIVATISGFQRM